MTTTTLILGGGFGGIAAANTLRRLLPPEHRIALVDQGARFHVGAGKTWVMLGERKPEGISTARGALLEPGIGFLQAQIRRIDLPGQQVMTAESALPWDYLVIALGADLNQQAVPGLAEAAHTFYTIEGAEKLRPVLDGFTAGEVMLLIPKTPFKCPPAPYEAALLLQEQFQKRGGSGVKLSLYTVEGMPMATAGPEMGGFIKEELARRGIAFFPQKATVRVDAPTRTVHFADNTSARYDLLISIPPHEAPAVLRETGLLNPAGWIPVNPKTMEVAAAAGGRVFAVGDVTAVPLPGRFKPDMPLALPKAGVMAEAQGVVAARRIAARILGTEPDANFDGRGFCYLETGQGSAVRAEGSFFELPHPVMCKQVPTAEQFRDKLDWVARHLAPRR